ncbi:zinc metalloprotease [Halorientalis regularis]|uniref:Zn-dependent protease (Includes SpoIVFB) n=1 Tax=Halorientalis regularis TaxID=660518 RepID=A0A1G7FXH3_9EURY|nr:Zn-dependent protease (includes SpoIVFB) [Halorientalis regularis]
MNIRFSTRELLDLGAAWVALSVAFMIIILRPFYAFPVSVIVQQLALSFVTVGVAFLLHELAHKVVAIRFGKIAEFRADYGMLFVAIMGATIGFLFAAPGAVYHQGRSTLRQNGLIALAGPVTNLVLAAIFAPLAFLAGGFLGSIGSLGLSINLFLAAFNMVPFGPLDGTTVKEWSTPVFVAVFVPSAALALWALFRLGLF